MMKMKMKMKMKMMLAFLLLWLYLVNHLHGFRIFPKCLKCIKGGKKRGESSKTAPQGNNPARRNKERDHDTPDPIRDPPPPPPLPPSLPSDAPPPLDAPIPDAYPVFVSIDCGASGNFTDQNQITWTGDEDLISIGFPHMVKSDDLISPVYKTLRAFNNTRKKNCYSIKANEGGKVLVRVVFNYGNYDGNESPPTFDLHFDGNFWITVDTSEAIFYEAIYVVKRKVISVCVAQTQPNQVPFISTLEVRSVDSEAYNMIGQDYALLTNYRIGYALENITRFPADPYDRMWNPVGDYTGLLRVDNEASFIYFTTVDNPPVTVLASAIVSPDIDTPRITLSFDTLVYPSHYPVYINWYFTEVIELTETENRSFRIYKDDEPFSFPIVPEFGNVSENTASNIFISPFTNFSIVASEDSTLPPLINAIEIFSISDVLTDGTNDNDVEGLDSLKNAFDVLKDWGGDPCLPAPYSWDWIECDNDARPRVTSLKLNGYNLNGPLPDFSSMDALEIIDLHNNSLTGSVPDFLGNMLNLKQLNLADNQFTGSIPKSLSGNSQLNLSDTGNHLSMSSSNKKKTSKLLVILAITIMVFFIF